MMISDFLYLATGVILVITLTSLALACMVALFNGADPLGQTVIRPSSFTPFGERRVSRTEATRGLKV